MPSRFNLLAFFVVVGLVASAAIAAYQPHRKSLAACRRPSGDSATLVRIAEDTVATLRGTAQRATQASRERTGYRVRTEDRSPLAVHDGGLVTFDCAGRISFVWLDGG